MADSNWLMQFPAMERADLVGLRKSLDSTYREFTRNYGDMIESFFDPLLYFRVWFEKFLLFLRRLDRDRASGRRPRICRSQFC